MSNIKSIYADKLAIGDNVFERFSAPNGKSDVEWYYKNVTGALNKIEEYPMKKELEKIVSLVFDN